MEKKPTFLLFDHPTPRKSTGRRVVARSQCSNPAKIARLGAEVVLASPVTAGNKPLLLLLLLGYAILQRQHNRSTTPKWHRMHMPRHPAVVSLRFCAFPCRVTESSIIPTSVDECPHNKSHRSVHVFGRQRSIQTSSSALPAC